MNPALGLLMTVLFVAMGFGLVALFGLWGTAKLKNAKLVGEVVRLHTALAVSQGYLENLSTSSIPGASDGAFTVLARIDALTKETK